MPYTVMMVQGLASSMLWKLAFLECYKLLLAMSLSINRA